MAPPENCKLPHEENCPYINEAIESAVKKVFAILGVDIDRPESVEEFREDLRFGKKMRRLADHSTLALFGVIMAGVAAALWAGIANSIGKGH